MNVLRISSISRRAAAVLRHGATGRVLATFERVCDLVTDAGEVVALVWGGIGKGPLNVVLAWEHAPDLALPPGTRFAVEGRILKVSALTVHEYPLEVADHNPPNSRIRGSFADGPPRHSSIDLASATPWDPRPDWERLRARRLEILAGAALIAAILADAGWTLARCGLPEALCERATGGDAEAIRALVGLGPGLTPAGDDWLAGWCLAQHIGGDLTGLRALSDLITEAVIDRTTTLSRAFLMCAAAGEADEDWHRLFTALTQTALTDQPNDGFVPEIAEPLSTDSPRVRELRDSFVHSLGIRGRQQMTLTDTILSHGATSGAAMLLGFCAGVGRLLPVS